MVNRGIYKSSPEKGSTESPPHQEEAVRQESAEGVEVGMEAYCVRCRAKREVKDPKSITMKNGKPATQGICPVCSTKLFRIGK